MEDNLSYRMYGLVPYNLSSIQKGIQFGHAVVEYSLLHNQTKEYIKWSTTDKTFIVLNGGTTNNNSQHLGTLNKYFNELIDNNILCGSFNEPDLGDQLTAIVFLVDERVWDKEKYPDEWFIEYDLPYHTTNMGEKFFGGEYYEISFLRKFLSNFKLA